jgi:hypothetical protein
MSRLAAILFVLVAAFPFRIYTEFAFFRSFSIFDLLLALTACILVFVVCGTGRLYVGDGLTFVLLGIPAAVALASIAWSEDPVISTRYSVHSVEAVVAYVAITNLLRNRSDTFIFVLMASFVVALLFGSALFYLEVPGFETPVTTAELQVDSEEYAEWMTGFGTRLGHPFIGQSNAFATILVFFVPVFLAYSSFADSHIARAVTVLCVIGLFLTLSRGAMLAVILALAVYGFLKQQTDKRAQLSKWIPALTLAVFCALALLTLVMSLPDFATVALESRLQNESIDARTRALELAGDEILKRPMLGSGAGTAESLNPELFGGVHNAYVELFVSYGIAFGLLVSTSIVLITYAAFRLRRYGKEPVAAGFVAGVIAVLVVFMTQASYESGPLRVLLYLAFGMVVSLLKSSTVRQPHTRAASKAVPA